MCLQPTTVQGEIRPTEKPWTESHESTDDRSVPVWEIGYDSMEDLGLDGQTRLPQGRNTPSQGQFEFGNKRGRKKKNSMGLVMVSGLEGNIRKLRLESPEGGRPCVHTESWRTSPAPRSTGWLRGRL